MDQRGQATPLVALVVLAIGGLLFGIARFGATVSHAAQAQAAADAGALAGAVEDRNATEAVVGANGGEVATYERFGSEIQVRAVVGDAWAVARARRAGGGGTVTGWVGRDAVGGAGGRLSPDLRDALAAAAALLRQPVPVTEAGGRWVAVPRTFAARLSGVAGRVGLCRSTRQIDPVRFAQCRASRG
jgi:hypothetical protein